LLNFVEENVLVQADNLRTHPSVSAALRHEKVRIFGWVYHFETGAVTVYDPRQNRFVPSVDVEVASNDSVVLSI
jgi:carbonic anhydrase